jgi:hypothetical protein
MDIGTYLQLPKEDQERALNNMRTGSSEPIQQTKRPDLHTMVNEMYDHHLERLKQDSPIVSSIGDSDTTAKILARTKTPR